MTLYYKFINGHTILTRDSKELDNQKLLGITRKSNVCKNCGMSGSDIGKYECKYKELQSIDMEIEAIANEIDDMEKSVKEFRLNKDFGEVV